MQTQYAKISKPGHLYHQHTQFSYLCIFSKEPVLVATLHSQQGVRMLLLQLDDLLLQGSVDALRAPGGDARAGRRTQVCKSSPSSSWLCKLSQAESLQKTKNIWSYIVTAFLFTPFPGFWTSVDPQFKLLHKHALIKPLQTILMLHTCFEASWPKLSFSLTSSSSSSSSGSSTFRWHLFFSMCWSVRSRGGWTLMPRSQPSASPPGSAEQVKPLSFSRVEEQRPPAPRPHFVTVSGGRSKAVKACL